MSDCRYRLDNLCMFKDTCSVKAYFSAGVTLTIDDRKHTVYGVCEEIE